MASERTPEELLAELRHARALSDELRLALERHRARLVALTHVLPAEFVELLGEDAASIEIEAAAGSVYEGWEDTTEVRPAHIEIELPLLWKRFGAGKEK